MSKLKLGIIFGGKSGEHEVSLVSAASIIKAINKKKYHVIEIGITKQGLWVTGKKLLESFKAGKVKSGSLLPPKIFTQLDVVFPVLHGTYGEDGTIQGLFEMLDVPYVGAGVLGSAIGMDKIVQKQLFEQAGLPVVKYKWVTTQELKNKKLLNYLITKLCFPMFIKPANLGSSVGISKAKNEKELILAIKLATKYDNKILIEQAVESPREIECSVLGNENPKASLPGEVIPSGEFYDYQAKYIDGLSKTIVPAKLSKNLIKKIQQYSLAAYKAIDCRGMARVDFLIKTQEYKNTKMKSLESFHSQIFVNEINTIPGFTSISMYPKLWQASGLPYAKLLDQLISLALKRHKQKSKLQSSFKPSKKWY